MGRSARPITESQAAALVAGDGTHKLPIKPDVRKAIGKEAGDAVTVRLEERVDEAA